MIHFIKKGLFIFMALLQVTCLPAQNQKALIIGIDKYTPPVGVILNKDGRTEWPNLNGCKNDARSIRSLIQNRYGFKSSDIQEIYDHKATRDNILHAMQRLLSSCTTGDIAFIYYAGHGSQQRNSKSIEADKKDESVVPSDTWKMGVGDIRDKEQAIIYNAFIDKGVKLTVIMDCCHSGSMSRGQMVYGRPQYRYIAESDYDANDGSQVAAPEMREGNNFLMISAAQDNEYAEEQDDDNKIPHGAFTLALMQAIIQQPVEASVTNLFTSIRAILKCNGKKQEPELAGSATRRKQTLFGIEEGTLSNKIFVPVSKLDKNKIEFLGGFALGLRSENELTMVNDTAVVVKIDRVLGVTSATGTLIKGNPSAVKPGLLFEVTNWVSSAAPMLKLFLPPPVFSQAEVANLAGIYKEIQSSGKVQWVNDLEKYEPYITLWYNLKKLNANIDGKLPDEVAAGNVREIITLAAGKTLFINLPPDMELVKALTNKFKLNQNISIVSDPMEANYILYGTLNQAGLLSYGFMSSQIALRDTLASMPLQTANFSLTGHNAEAHDELADSLYGVASRLAKIRGWLTLQSPKNDNFPFHLSIISSVTNKEVGAEGYKVGDKATLHLVANANNRQLSIPEKFIYVFVIDRNGNMQLAFPQNNEDNRFPSSAENKADKILVDEYEVSEPVGTDNFFLLACNEKIANAEQIFKQEGVIKRDIGNRNAMETLLNMGNEGSRGYLKTPGNWNLIKLQVKTTY